jgi:hypothetical protein
MIFAITSSTNISIFGVNLCCGANYTILISSSSVNLQKTVIWDSLFIYDAVSISVNGNTSVIQMEDVAFFGMARAAIIVQEYDTLILRRVW